MILAMKSSIQRPSTCDSSLRKHYKGLRTLAEWDESNAQRRLEWDPLMICAPAPLRYSLLAAMQVPGSTTSAGVGHISYRL